MSLGLLGLKVGMTQVYDEAGKLAPVTVLQAGPCPVLLVREQQRDGYDAVQIGFIDKPRRKATRQSVATSRRSWNRIAAGRALRPAWSCRPRLTASHNATSANSGWIRPRKTKLARC